MSGAQQNVPVALQAHLDTGTTTLAHCWRVTRTDGVSLGFTDHDAMLTYEGTQFDPQTGAETSEIQSRTGLAVDNAEISGALLGDGIAEADLSSGLYDGARVETWLVNWADVSQRHLIANGRFGAIKWIDGAWQVEVRGLGDELSQVRGRRFGRRCDARLGDERCGVNLSLGNRRIVASVAAVAGTKITLTGAQLSSLDDGDLAAGLIKPTDGSAGYDISDHYSDASGTHVRVWGGTRVNLAAGDAVQLTVGCDKRWSTCRNRFANGHNFRGFPHIPGNDFALATAKEDQLHDGSPLVVDDD